MESNYSRLIKKLRSVKKPRTYDMLLIPVALLFIFGLYFSVLPQHQVYYTTLKEFSYNGSTWDVNLHFDSSNGFFAQTPITVNGHLHTYSDINHYKENMPVIFIKDAAIEGTAYQIQSSMCGAQMRVYFDGSIVPNNIIFPFEGDYEAFLVFPANYAQQYKKAETISLGKVIHVSSPGSAILFKTNQIMTGLTLIVTGMTIFQIWVSWRSREEIKL